MSETRQTAEDIAELKKKFIEYYRDVPVQKYAAMYIGRDETTIVRWKNEDEDFANAVEEARAEWVRKKALKVKAEFALERLEKDTWSERKEVKLDDQRKEILEKYGLDDAGETEKA